MATSACSLLKKLILVPSSRKKSKSILCAVIYVDVFLELQF